MFNWDIISESSKQSITGILWFLFLVPLAMGAHYAAKYFEMIEFTIMGWFLATLGGTQLGWAMKNRRLYSLPIKINHPFSQRAR